MRHHIIYLSMDSLSLKFSLVLKYASSLNDIEMRALPLPPPNHLKTPRLMILVECLMRGESDERTSQLSTENGNKPVKENGEIPQNFGKNKNRFQLSTTFLPAT